MGFSKISEAQGEWVAGGLIHRMVCPCKKGSMGKVGKGVSWLTVGWTIFWIRFLMVDV